MRVLAHLPADGRPGLDRQQVCGQNHAVTHLTASPGLPVAQAWLRRLTARQAAGPEPLRSAAEMPAWAPPAWAPSALPARSDPADDSEGPCDMSTPSLAPTVTAPALWRQASRELSEARSKGGLLRAG